MCGRYTLTIDIENIFAHFGIKIYEDRGSNPQYNVAPSHAMPIITEDLSVDYLKWGVTMGKHFVINSRSDGRSRHSSIWHRCLVPADGFFEWRTEGGIKQPYYFKVPNINWFMFAGLYQNHQQGGFTILTTKANNQLAKFHHRMPIILDSNEHHQSWLNKNILPTTNPTLSIHAVSKLVNSTRNNNIECIKPLTDKQLSLF